MKGPRTKPTELPWHLGVLNVITNHARGTNKQGHMMRPPDLPPNARISHVLARRRVTRRQNAHIPSNDTGGAN